MNRRLLIVNNIPTPYRVFMFQKFYEHGKRCGVDVTVAFQAQRAPHRAWHVSDFQIGFPHFFSTGLGITGRQVDVFRYSVLNRDILRTIRRGEYDWVLMSPYMSISNWLFSMVPTRTRRLLWAESNLDSAHHKGWLARSIKRKLADRYDALVCPGQKAVDYLVTISPKLASAPKIWLPNIVDPTIFVTRVEAARARRDETRKALGVAPSTVLAVAVGQMIRRKGFPFLLEAVGRVHGDYRVIALGDGPYRKAWLRHAEQIGVSDRISFPGFKKEDEVAAILGAADWFIHVATADPSPLVCIEACTAGLPMAVSRQTGNSPEVVDEGRNGFTFNPRNPAEMDACLRRLLETPREKLPAMGEISSRRAAGRFEPGRVMDSVFQGILRLAN